MKHGMATAYASTGHCTQFTVSALCQVNEPYFGGDWTKLACKAYESGVHMTEDWWRNLYSQCALVSAFQVNSCTVLMSLDRRH